MSDDMFIGRTFPVPYSQELDARTASMMRAMTVTRTSTPGAVIQVGTTVVPIGNRPGVATEAPRIDALRSYHQLGTPAQEAIRRNIAWQYDGIKVDDQPDGTIEKGVISDALGVVNLDVFKPSSPKASVINPKLKDHWHADESHTEYKSRQAGSAAAPAPTSSPSPTSSPAPALAETSAASAEAKINKVRTRVKAALTSEKKPAVAEASAVPAAPVTVAGESATATLPAVATKISRSTKTAKAPAGVESPSLHLDSARALGELSDTHSTIVAARKDRAEAAAQRTTLGQASKAGTAPGHALIPGRADFGAGVSAFTDKVYAHLDEQHAAGGEGSWSSQAPEFHGKLVNEAYGVTATLHHAATGDTHHYTALHFHQNDQESALLGYEHRGADGQVKHAHLRTFSPQKQRNGTVRSAAETLHDHINGLSLADLHKAS